MMCRGKTNENRPCLLRLKPSCSRRYNSIHNAWNKSLYGMNMCSSKESYTQIIINTIIASTIGHWKRYGNWLSPSLEIEFSGSSNKESYVRSMRTSQNIFYQTVSYVFCSSDQTAVTKDWITWRGSKMWYLIAGAYKRCSNTITWYHIDVIRVGDESKHLSMSSPVLALLCSASHAQFSSALH